MLARQKQVVEAYERVQDFLAANPAPAGTTYGRPQAILNETVARLTEHRTDQVAGRRLSTAERNREKALRSALRELHLRPISKIAKATLADQPGIDKALKMPAPQLSTTKLIDEAKAMRDAVTQYSPTFVTNGRPEDFLARLDAAIGELRASMLGKARSVGTKVGAKAGLEQEIKRGRSAVEMLDAIVTTVFANDGERLAKWRIARRVRGVTGGGAVAPTGGTADENLPPATGQEGV
jgi:hypothetical protein